MSQLLNVLCTICAFFLFFLIFFVTAEEVSLPKSVRTCKRDSNDYSSCLRLAIQQAWPTFVKGIPELNVPSLDPYMTPIYENSYKNGDILGKVVTKNTRSYGFSNINFLAVRPHFQNNRFRLEIDVEFPKFFVEGEYKAEGYFQEFKMGGKGLYNVSAEGITTTWDIDGRIENDRWVIEHFTILPEITKMKIWFTDLFNGDKNLNNAVISLVNEYWPLFYRQLLPVMSKTWDTYFTELLNHIFSKISFSKTFP